MVYETKIESQRNNIWIALRRKIKWSPQKSCSGKLLQTSCQLLESKSEPKSEATSNLGAKPYPSLTRQIIDTLQLPILLWSGAREWNKISLKKNATTLFLWSYSLFLIDLVVWIWNKEILLLLVPFRGSTFCSRPVNKIVQGFKGKKMWWGFSFRPFVLPSPQ